MQAHYFTVEQVFLPTHIPCESGIYGVQYCLPNITRSIPSDLAVTYAVALFKQFIKTMDTGDWVELNSRLYSVRTVLIEPRCDYKLAIKYCEQHIQRICIYFTKHMNILMNDIKFAMGIFWRCLQSNIVKAKYLCVQLIRAMNMQRTPALNALLYKSWTTRFCT